jgi:hypothetical protein
LPWFQEIEAARVALQAPAPERIGFFEGIEGREADELLMSFAAGPRIDDAQRGRIVDEAEFRAYVDTQREWLTAQRGFETTSVTQVQDRGVEEITVRLADGGELAVAVVSDLAPDGRLAAIRVYRGWAG